MQALERSERSGSRTVTKAGGFSPGDSRNYVRIEKNLSSLGFFTPSHKKITGQHKKVVENSRTANGETIVLRTTVVASPDHGLPITADQDKYIALHRIINDIKRRDGKVSNPIAFSSSEILSLLGKTDAGNNYKEIQEWLDRMFLTGIISEGTVYLASEKKKVWGKDRFRVFDRVVSVGAEIAPGKKADKNYVWLSEWQIENINNNYLLPVDFDTYKQLRNHISKALAPLLHIWLYASKNDGCFEKRYDELCAILAITEYRHLSQIKRKLGPSLDELTDLGYLSRWEVGRTASDRAFKIVFHHGEKFVVPRELVAGKSNGADADKELPESELTPASLKARLKKRGISDRKAHALVDELPQNLDEALRMIEWAEREIDRTRPQNPAGFMIHLIQEKVTPPEDFLSSLQVSALEKESEAQRLRDEELARQHAAYDEYRQQEIDKHIKALPPSEYEARIDAKKQELIGRFDALRRSPTETVRQSAEHSLRHDIEKELRLVTFQEYYEQRAVGSQDSDESK
jgi:hypothetical protein